MAAISSQGSSLLSVDLSDSDVTDAGLGLLKDCSNLQALTLNYCDRISDHGLKHISGTIYYFCLCWFKISFMLFTFVGVLQIVIQGMVCY